MGQFTNEMSRLALDMRRLRQARVDAHRKMATKISQALHQNCAQRSCEVRSLLRSVHKTRTQEAKDAHRERNRFMGGLQKELTGLRKDVGRFLVVSQEPLREFAADFRAGGRRFHTALVSAGAGRDQAAFRMERKGRKAKR